MNTKRDEAREDAAQPAERPATHKEADAKLAAKEAQIRQEADAEFREDVRKATEKRDKKLAKLTLGVNIAEKAWNETKAEDDPPYNAISSDHRQRLDTVVQAVRETGNADVVGLEEFEARVLELVKEQGGPTGTALVPATTANKAEEVENAKSAKEK